MPPKLNHRVRPYPAPESQSDKTQPKTIGMHISTFLSNGFRSSPTETPQDLVADNTKGVPAVNTPPLTLTLSSFPLLAAATVPSANEILQNVFYEN